MSSTDPSPDDWDNIDRLAQFIRTYCEDELAALYSEYPKEKVSLYVEWGDLFQFDPDLAYDYLDTHDQIRALLRRAFFEVDHPVQRTEWNDLVVRVTDTRGLIDRVGVGELGSRHIGQFIALRCQVGQVTGRMSRIREAAFECQRCGTITRIPQSFTDFQEPHECDGCERQGPFHINYGQSDLVDQRKVQCEEPPEEQIKGSGQTITAFVIGDLCDVGGPNGLPDRAGDRVTILGKVEGDDTGLQGRGSNEPIIEKYLRPEAIIFDDEHDATVDIEEHRATVEELAAREDAIDLFRTNIDAGLTLTEDWDKATEMATAYLFGSPRIDVSEGEMVRGDLHMLMVSDPGMRKSVFAKKLNEIAPQATLRQATGMSSDVGLTAAATQDDFGDGGWSLKPGALPRANGGHLILDEIDKGPDGLGGIHDALEGEQKLKIDKAGIQATLATRVGFLALGNPADGRFDEELSIPEQINLDPALMSRFDLVVTMRDETDEAMDGEIARDVLDDIGESLDIQFGDLDPQEASSSSRDIPAEVMTAWVALAREEITPKLTAAAKDLLAEFYVDTRQLNNGQETSTPPVTARKLVAGYRLASAFARCELSETIEPRHAERAIGVSRNVVAENWDGEQFDADRTTEGAVRTNTHKSRMDRVKKAIRDGDGITEEEVAEQADVSLSKVEYYVQKLKRKGAIYEPQTGVLRWS
jgi:replicative DNA helicase Mcm